MIQPVSVQTLQEMKAYYRQRASEYDESYCRQGRYDRGPEMNARWFAELDEVFAALDAFHLAGEVLELAAGTGIWTKHLVRTASTVTSVDASPEMLAINRAKVASHRVRYVLVDLFSWHPEHVYDAVFFGFWLSHVPRERLDDFLRSCVAMLHPAGKIFFVDSRRPPNAPGAPHQATVLESQVVVRTLRDGRTFEVVKNLYDATDLTARCIGAGFDLIVCQTATHFLYGSGTRRR
jgi:2-polyprenyl-3-methyl-5-hydroxy-6-metoxy-1,4-benzoquinol methylase